MAGSAAYAQQRDEAWVVAQIMSGKLDDLRALEKLSDESVRALWEKAIQPRLEVRSAQIGDA